MTHRSSGRLEERASELARLLLPELGETDLGRRVAVQQAASAVVGLAVAGKDECLHGRQKMSER